MQDKARPLEGKRVLIIVENLPVPFDRRVWNEAVTLVSAGAKVSVVCPVGKGFEKRFEVIDDVHVYRHPLPLDAARSAGYLLEYGAALFWETVLAWRIFFSRGLDLIHGCNPPDLIFLVAGPFKIFGVRFLFDHHDINPELYEAKFNRRDLFWKLLIWFERLTFKIARVSIATNESYKKIAIERGGMLPDNVFIVRSGPDLARLEHQLPNNAWKNGRRYLVGYVGVMGDQEGIDYLLKSAMHIVFTLRRDDIQFCLVGGGPSFDRLKRLTANMGLAGYVTFVGRAPDRELFEVLSTSDVCVNPDIVNEMNDKSTMNKIMEYMAFGKPIVQFDVTEGRFSAQRASLYAKPNDPVDMAEKILELLSSPQQRATMGAYGRRRVEGELAWEHQVNSLIAAYEKAFE